MISNTNLDSGTAPGWSIGNARWKSNIANTSWTPSSNRIRFEIRGTGGTTTNNPPTVANAIPDQSATAGTAFSYVFPDTTFSDADTSDTLTYTATKADDTALPTWLAFAASTRTFSGTPQAADIGTVAVKVTASDGNGGSVSDAFDITVAADTTPPTLTSAYGTSAGTYILLVFSENLQGSNMPPASAFTVTAGGNTVTVGNVNVSPSGETLVIGVSPLIRHGQAVVATYTDPTTGDDTAAIQDTAGNDTATFTTGMNGVPYVFNTSTVTNTPRDRRADDHRHGAGRADADGGHHRHHGCRRADQRQLHVPVDPDRCRRGYEHLRGDGEHLHAGGGRPGHDDQGEGELHRRRQQRRDADQRGDGGRRGGAEHPSLGV